MADRLTITVEANDQASTVIESLKKKLDELSRQTDSAGARSQDFDKQIKTVAASIESLGARISTFSNDLVSAGQTISQTGRQIGSSLGTEILTSTTGSLSQLSTLMQSWGANAARAFAQGLRAGSSEVSSAAYDISDILAGYLQVHSPTKYGPLSVEDPKNWTTRLAKLLSQGLLSGKGLIENGVDEIGSIFAKLDISSQLSLSGLVSNIQWLFGRPNISSKFLMNMEAGAVLPFDEESLRKEFEDYKKAQDYQAFYDTVVKWPTSGMDFEQFRKNLDQKYQYSNIPDLLEGSQIDAGTGLPTAISQTKWFQAFAPEYSLGQLEQIYGGVIGQSLKNFPAWNAQADVETRLDWENLSADDFIAKYGMSMIKSDSWNKIGQYGLSAKYDMNMFRDLIPIDVREGMQAVPETESGRAIKSAWELFGGFANTLIGLKGSFEEFYGGTTLGWTPERIQEMMGLLEDVFGMSEGAWDTYVSKQSQLSLDSLANSEAVKTGRKPLFSELLGLGGDWGTVQFTSELLSNMSMMDFESALSKTAQTYKDQAVTMRMAELDGSPYANLADPNFRETYPEETAKLLLEYLQGSESSSGLSSLSSLSGSSLSSLQSSGAIQINQEFNINLGDYNGSLSELVKAIAQSAAIEAQQALLDIVQFRGV
ncbi:MAG: hypothetical protein KA140_03170 [Caldisericia bacterium]|nr:hypothetical protein [Caldisericia bacterium]